MKKKDLSLLKKFFVGFLIIQFGIPVLSALSYVFTLGVIFPTFIFFPPYKQEILGWHCVDNGGQIINFFDLEGVDCLKDGSYYKSVWAGTITDYNFGIYPTLTPYEEVKEK